MDKKITVRELKKLATKHKIKGRSRMNKTQLLDALKPFMDKHEGPKNAKKRLNKPGIKEAITSEATRQKPENPAEQEMAGLGELPFSYNEDVIELLPKNPEELYAFWDLSTTTWERVAGAGSMVIRLEIPGVKTVWETRIHASVREYYFRIPDQRGPYRVTLFLDKGTTGTEVLMRSDPIKAPPNHPGPGSLRFAKVPFHVPLPDLKRQGGLLPPDKAETPRGPFILGEIDDTPYTRRFR